MTSLKKKCVATVVTTHFEKLRTMKIFFTSALNLGPSRRTLNFFFQSALISAILIFCLARFIFIFFLFKNFKDNYTFLKKIDLFKCFNDDSINRTFVCQGFEVILLEKSGLHHANQNNICVDSVSVFLTHVL